MLHAVKDPESRQSFDNPIDIVSEARRWLLVDFCVGGPSVL